MEPDRAKSTVTDDDVDSLGEVGPRLSSDSDRSPVHKNLTDYSAYLTVETSPISSPRYQQPPPSFVDVLQTSGRHARPAALSLSSNLGNESPLLLSPVLARPRSLSSYSAVAGGLLRKPSDSEAELSGYLNSGSPPFSLGDIYGVCPSPPPFMTQFPRSVSAAQAHTMNSGLVAPSPVARLLARTRSDAGDRASRRRRKSTCSGSMVMPQHPMNLSWSMSMGSSSGGWETPPSGSMSNLSRLRGSSLGQSAPQLTAPSLGGPSSSHSNLSLLSAPAVKLRKEIRIQRRHSNRLSRRSFHASTAPIRSHVGQTLTAEASGVAPRIASPLTVQSGAAGTSSGTGAPRSTSQMAARTGSQSGSTLQAPANPDPRRWSVASLPSSSGYGTPGSSAFSSQYSSQERLAGAMEDLHLSKRFGSNDSNPSLDDLSHTLGLLNQSAGAAELNRPVSPIMRVRSRSLSSLAWLNLSSYQLENSPVKLQGENSSETVIRNNVYKERFPKAKQQMEERLDRFVADNALVSGGSSCYHLTSSQNVDGEEECSSLESSLNVSDPELIRILADGAARFLHHQIIELAGDCSQKSKEDLLSSVYFWDMSQSLEDLLNKARQKTPNSFGYLSTLVRQLLIIVSRTARLLECLEFDPNEFYQLLEEAEGQVREQLPSDAQVTDLPQYIIGKLGLDKDHLVYSASTEDTRTSTPVGFDGNESFNSSGDTDMTDSVNMSGDKAPGAMRRESGEKDVGRQLFAGGRAPSEEDFESIKLISNGAYGAVYLVRHKQTRQRFALKKMNKTNLMLRNQVEQVFAERDILTFTDNPFVVSFYGSFETKRHLCMVLEYVEGGDCASLLKKVEVLPVDLARMYVAETVLAVEYLHSYGIVHRDLKPDNLLITAMGHVKLTDFGLSKIGLMNRTTLLCEGCFDVSETQQFQDKQLCGTPEYIAPEVILRQGYGKPVDWWATGIIMYEFLCGVVPFFGDTPEELFAHVISDEIEWPEEPFAPPDEAKDLITLLLQQNPLERLGTLQGAMEVKLHPFFDGVNWNSLLRQKAEFIPQLESEEDTSYFDTRADRHNHEVESGDEDTWSEESGSAASSMFWSFSSASPRHSIGGESMRQPTPEPQPPEKRKVSAQSQSSLTSQNSLGAQSEADSTESGMGTEDVTDRSRASSDVQVVFRPRMDSHRTVSSSSSGGSPCLTAGNSLEGNPPVLKRMDNAVEIPLGDPNQDVDVVRRRRTATVPLPRFAISCDFGDGKEVTKELSPVEERQPTPDSQAIHPIPITSDVPVSAAPAIMYRHRTSSLRKKTAPAVSSPLVTKSPSLHLEIPPSPPPVPPTGTSPPQSSASSRDGSPSRMRSGSNVDLSPLIMQLKPPVVIRKGPKGYGFTLRSVRVYLGEDSDYYTIQHIVTSVAENSPAWEAGLGAEDLITHVNGEPVQNLTHPQLMHRLLSYGDQLSIRVTPMENTSIRVGAARKSAGKLARKKGYKQKLQRRAWEKKRKVSLLRRLSGKRTSAELSTLAVQGTKTTILPRSVSSQEGMTPAGQAPPTAPQQQPIRRHHHHRLSDAGLQGLSGTGNSGTPSTSSPSSSSGPQSPPIPLWQSRPSSLHGLKHKIAQTFNKSPGRRKQAQTMPLSPLARADTLPPPTDGTVSPTRSPSPLAGGVMIGPSPGMKKTITKPRKSDLGGSELLRMALSPPSATDSTEEKS